MDIALFSPQCFTAKSVSTNESLLVGLPDNLAMDIALFFFFQCFTAKSVSTNESLLVGLPDNLAMDIALFFFFQCFTAKSVSTNESLLVGLPENLAMEIAFLYIVSQCTRTGQLSFYCYLPPKAADPLLGTAVRQCTMSDV